jgi:phage shock protein PspC (stress-responsive transcriptional regulator)
MDTTDTDITITDTDNANGNTGDRSRLQRAVDGRILGGVAAGLSQYLDIDIAVVRIGFVALGLLGGIAIPLYLAGWLLIPEEGSDSTIADELLEHAHPS